MARRRGTAPTTSGTGRGPVPAQTIRAGAKLSAPPPPPASASAMSASTARSNAWLSGPGASAEWIDARFERAVDMVQSLPRNGPIQTSYDDKLLLYSVYKQATEGNVKQSRPGLLDVLGRAKWDAWNKRKDLSPLEARRLYVDALIRILRGYADRTEAKEMIHELQNFTLEEYDSEEDDMTESESEEEPVYERRRHRAEPSGSTSRLEPPASLAAPPLPGYGPPRTGRDTPPRQHRPQAPSIASGSSFAAPFRTPRTDAQQTVRTPIGAPTPNRPFSPTLSLSGYVPPPPPPIAFEPPSATRGGAVALEHGDTRPPVEAPKQPALDQALERIQTSLTTLYERLNELETRQRAGAGEYGTVASHLAEFWRAVVTFIRGGRARERTTWRMLFTSLVRSLLNAFRRLAGDVAVAALIILVITRGRADVARGWLALLSNRERRVAH